MTDHLASRLAAPAAAVRSARMRTPWRSSAPLLAIAVTVVVGGCMNPPASTDSQPSSSTSVEQTTVPTTPAEPSCPPSGLFVSAGPVDGAAGLRAVTLTAFNCATSTAPVEGYPQLQLLDEAQAVIDVTVMQELDPVGGLTDVPVTPLTLLPGQTAQAVLLWRNTVELGEDNTPRQLSRGHRHPRRHGAGPRAGRGPRYHRRADRRPLANAGISTDQAPDHGLDGRGRGPEGGAPRRRWLPAAAAALTAGVLWVGSGVLNRVLLWNLESVPYQVINLLVPPALDFNLRPGEYQVGTFAVLTAVVVAVVVGIITHLTARTLPGRSNRLPLFIGSWFAAVVASTLGSTLQVVTAFVDQWDPMFWGAVVNGLIPYLTGGGWWGLALGWVVGLVAVLTHRHVSRPAAPPR